MSSSADPFRVEVLLPPGVHDGVPPDGRLVVEEPVANLGELTEALERLHPGLGGALRSSLYTFAVNGEIVLRGKATRPVRSGDRIEVMPIFAGG